MGGNKTDIEKLKAIPENDYLNKSADEKYNYFKDKDPFPNIPSALLNSNDILRYIMTTGMVDPFDPEHLGDATYTCTFSGEYLRYDSKNKLENKKLSDNEELIIKPNSITYLQINEVFRVPQYMVLRFNLKVKHVYKGLLLGTGPIVDPQFVGHLNIPLHNLTTNEYVIKKGAKLIDVEFTKLSIKNEWKFNLSNKKMLDFSLLYSCIKEENKEKDTNKDKTIIEYIKSSLQDNALFFKKDKHKLSVGSSLAYYVKKLENLKKKSKNLKKKSTLVNILTYLGIFITVFTLLIPTWQSFASIQKDRDDYRDIISQYKKEVDELEKRIIVLEIENQKVKLDTMKNEYTAYTDKDSDEAIELKKQVTELEEEISELQKQLH